MKYILYTVTGSERWDAIAYKIYGSPYLIQPIIEANPHVKIDVFVPDGTELKIPVLNKKLKNAELPPWKRGRDD